MKGLFNRLTSLTLLGLSLLLTSQNSCASSWHSQLVDCLKKNSCPTATSIQSNPCCKACIQSLSRKQSKTIVTFLSTHPTLACSLKKTTTSHFNTTDNPNASNNEAHSSARLPTKGKYLFSLLIGGWWNSSHIAQNCNRDRLLLNVNLDVFQTNQHQLFSHQVDGSMVFSPLKRCPRTMYGGVKTLEGPYVRLIGTKKAKAFHLQLLFKDKSTFYYTSGKSYSTGDLLNQAGILIETKGVNIKGILPHFIAPASLMTPDSQLEFDTPKSTSNTLWWSGKVTVFVYQRKRAPETAVLNKQ